MNKNKVVLGILMVIFSILIAGCQKQGGGDKGDMTNVCTPPNPDGKDRFVEVFIDSNGKLAVSQTDAVIDIWGNDMLQWKRRVGDPIGKMKIVFENKENCQSSPEVSGTNPCINGWNNNSKESNGVVTCKAKPNVGCPTGTPDHEAYNYCYSISGWDKEGNKLPTLDPVARGRR